MHVLQNKYKGRFMHGSSSTEEVCYKKSLLRSTEAVTVTYLKGITAQFGIVNKDEIFSRSAPEFINLAILSCSNSLKTSTSGCSQLSYTLIKAFVDDETSNSPHLKEIYYSMDEDNLNIELIEKDRSNTEHYDTQLLRRSKSFIEVLRTLFMSYTPKYHQYTLSNEMYEDAKYFSKIISCVLADKFLQYHEKNKDSIPAKHAFKKKVELDEFKVHFYLRDFITGEASLSRIIRFAAGLAGEFFKRQTRINLALSLIELVPLLELNIVRDSTCMTFIGEIRKPRGNRRRIRFISHSPPTPHEEDFSGLGSSNFNYKANQSPWIISDAIKFCWNQCEAEHNVPLSFILTVGLFSTNLIFMNNCCLIVDTHTRSAQGFFDPNGGAILMAFFTPHEVSEYLIELYNPKPNQDTPYLLQELKYCKYTPLNVQDVVNTGDVQQIQSENSSNKIV